ncbi:MAG: hypothetical protein ABJA50_00965 [Chloroflexota bacterium]
MTKPPANRTLKSKLLLPGLLLANLLAFGILLWQDWGETPVAKLPLLYWLLYAGFLCVLVAAIMVGRSQTRSARAAIMLATIFIIHGTVFVIIPLIGEWNGTRVMTFALGLWFLLYSAIMLLSAKRTAKATIR